MLWVSGGFSEVNQLHRGKRKAPHKVFKHTSAFKINQFQDLQKSSEQVYISQTLPKVNAASLSTA